MTEGHNTYDGAYCHGDARRAPQSSLEGLSTKKTMLVLVVVVGCFAVLWPKLFYPMLVSNANNHIKPGPVDKTAGCCDVISELDVDTIKILAELCSSIIDHKGEKPLGPKEIVFQCRKSVLETCGIDISAALQDRISLGHSAKQILDEVRSLNGSLCLKYNFGVSPWRLGVPHRVNINLDPANSIRQERPAHLRPGMVHPAFKERGRAIPEAEPSVTPKRSGLPPRIVEGRPGPIPGMRPTLGGPGHVVPPSKQTNYGFMGVLMPIYTVGFVIFFSYTIMKLVFKKKPDTYAGASLYPPCESDEHFQKDVFDANKHYFNRPNRDHSKIGDDELDQLRKRLRETELAMERIVLQMAQAPFATQDETKLPKEEDQGSVTVMAMETTASCENGKKWSRPDSPTLPHPHPAPPKDPSPPPQQIFLEGALPPQSQILVADSATEAQKDTEDDSPVVLAGKMTLSVISMDSETGTEDSNAFGRMTESPEDERRRSSSNVSDEFEKINAADLEDQIDSIIREAGTLALVEENRFSLVEKPHEVPRMNEEERDIDILEEIKNQFNLEDDLLQALREKEPESNLDLPVTDIIKEFLSNEENAFFEGGPEIISAAEEQDPTQKAGAENNDDIMIVANEDSKAEIAALVEKEAVRPQLEERTEEAATENNENTLIITSEEKKPEIIDDVREETERSQDFAEDPMVEDEDNLMNAKKLVDDVESKEQDEEANAGPLETIQLQEPTPTRPYEPPDAESTEVGDSVRNMADLLLQGLLVKEELVDVDEETPEEEDIEYEDQSENEDLDEENEVREPFAQTRVNGDDMSRNGAGNSETLENENSDNELDDDDDEEIEEIIEYVDDTDDEGEEIVEINGNERVNHNEPGGN